MAKIYPPSLIEVFLKGVPAKKSLLSNGATSSKVNLAFSMHLHRYWGVPPLGHHFSKNSYQRFCLAGIEKLGPGYVKVSEFITTKLEKIHLHFYVTHCRVNQNVLQHSQESSSMFYKLLLVFDNRQTFFHRCTKNYDCIATSRKGLDIFYKIFATLFDVAVVFPTWNDFLWWFVLEDLFLMSILEVSTGEKKVWL